MGSDWCGGLLSKGGIRAGTRVPKVVETGVGVQRHPCTSYLDGLSVSSPLAGCWSLKNRSLGGAVRPVSGADGGGGCAVAVSPTRGGRGGCQCRLLEKVVLGAASTESMLSGV